MFVAKLLLAGNYVNATTSKAPIWIKLLHLILLIQKAIRMSHIVSIRWYLACAWVMLIWCFTVATATSAGHAFTCFHLFHEDLVVSYFGVGTQRCIILLVFLHWFMCYSGSIGYILRCLIELFWHKIARLRLLMMERCFYIWLREVTSLRNWLISFLICIDCE